MNTETHSSHRKRLRTRAAVTTATYAVLAGLWIYTSDTLLELIISDASMFAAASIYKGLVFVTVTSALLYSVLRRAPGSAGTPRPSEDVGFRMWPPLLFFGLFVAAVAGIGWFVHRGIERTVIGKAEEMLDAVADLKAQQVADWFAQRRSHAARTMHNPFVVPPAEAWLARGGVDDETAEIVRSRLRGLIGMDPWTGAQLFDTEGGVRLSVGAAGAPTRESTDFAMTAINTRSLAVRDLHRDEKGKTAITFFVPLLVSEGGSERAVGVVALELDASAHLFPLVARWPVASRTGESLLVRREGDSAVYLTDLRHRPGSALALHMRTESEKSVIGEALKTRHAPVAGLDYRGVSVLSSSRTIRGAPWVLIAKIDQAEVRGPLADGAALVALFGAMLVMLAGLAASFWLRQQRSAALVRHYRAERERAALSRRLDDLTRYANDVILLIGGDRTILDANERAVTAYGRSREELIGSGAASLRAEGATPTFDEEWELGSRDDGVVFESVHARSDGSTFPVEISTRAISVEGMVLRQSIVRDISERKAGEEALRESEEKYRLLFSNEQDAIVLFDPENGRIVDANDAFVSLSGYSHDQVRGRAVFDFSADPEASRRSIEAVKSTGSDRVHARRLKRRDGREIWVELGLNSFVSGGRRLVSAILRDITERKASEERTLLWSNVLDNTAEGVIVTDASWRIVQVNKAFTALTGYAAEEAFGNDPRLLASARYDDDFYRSLRRAVRETGRWQGEVWNRRRNGENYPGWLSLTAVRNTAGELTHYVGIFSDVSERKAAAETIEFLANHDALTGLPNRSVMNDLAQQSVAIARRKSSELALLFLDLDRFKTINESLGHPTGDALLQQIARLLKGVLRDEDIVSRVGGDEFLILLPELERGRHAALVAEKLLTELRKPLSVDEHTLRLTASIGISVFPQDGNDVATLIRNADAAMSHAKERGRNGYQFFTSDMNTRAFEALSMEMSLRSAVERGDFSLLYQPQVESVTGSIVAAEALIRWHHPELGLIPPATFIPIAEEQGLIVPIGEWVIRTVCMQLRSWRDAGLPVVPIAVNVSAVHFRQADLASSVRAIIEESGTDPRHLELELTESIVMRDAEQAIEVLQELSQMGVSLAIDDFGTGYSSLSYLRRFPIDRLKIDQSFVAEVTTSPDAAAIAVAIIGMGRTMKLRVVAEGVETAEQLAFLTAERCHELQGFHIARPMDAERLSDLLIRGAPLVPVSN